METGDSRGVELPVGNDLERLNRETKVRLGEEGIKHLTVVITYYLRNWFRRKFVLIE